MKVCKYCQAEMAENGNFCPVCGKNNSEEAVEEVVTAEETAVVAEPVAEPAEETAVEVKEEKKATPGKIAVAVVAVVAFLVYKGWKK